ncbi:MAG: RNA polymerase subunit sigma-70 [Candidatus Eremiobacteraeota bacterium]|nr:RNA polymerase subunit sigma-70 [Candidatus Eremiobacteraeota bacterium]MBV9409687.1 RNA polymerase subunit sigma-70 [Candidatus Eremiobacteraeota bacterium]
MSAAPAYDAAERAAREGYGKLLAFLAARCGDVDAAEDALADAFTSALERWPADGVPHNPEAWLLVAARRRFVDHVRRERSADRAHDRLTDAARDAQAAFERGEMIDDERLALIFACAHPAIARELRAPLILQTILGLDAARIASAFLTSPATMSQRLVRAKRKIAAAHIPLRIPPDENLAERLDGVLDALYAAFAAGWSDPIGDDPHTHGLAFEAIWLARLVAAACPDEPETLGLLALMLHADARRDARRDATGAYIPLDDQDPSRWDAASIDEAEALLARAAHTGRIGRFQLEAAIQSAYAVRRFGHDPDRTAIVAFYDALLARTNSPVVAINRAVALGRLHGPNAALAALDAAATDPRLITYQPYWAARADALARAGNPTAAHDAYTRALGLTVDPAIRRFLTARAAREGAAPPPDNRRSTPERWRSG